MTKLIGFGGKLRSGKDTAADYLVEEYGWVKLNMSAPLHDAMLALNPLIPMEFRYSTGHWRYRDLVEKVGYTEAKENPEVRRLLQALGTEVGRKMFGENVWVDIAAQNIDALRDQGHNVVITGIRFPNEVDLIHQDRGHGAPGELVWVERPTLEQPEGQLGTHASEALGPEFFDTTLLNDSSLGDLYTKVEPSTG
jgi:hypothetical protein